MKQTLKLAIKRTSLYRSIRRWQSQSRQRAALADWEQRGRPSPPPHPHKQRVLRDYAVRYNLRTLVETGTYYGDMVAAMTPFFDRIYSIELSADLHNIAKERFRRERHVELLHGDSGQEIESLMKRIDEPCLFWLDGHYSAGVTARGNSDTPIREEISNILRAKKMPHVILIDDARCFGADSSYPSLQELQKLVLTYRSDMDFFVEDDCIRLTPRP